MGDKNKGYPMLYYLLDETGTPQPTRDTYACEQLLRNVKACTVGRTHITFRGHNVEVSTVFLVIDHAFFGGDPVLWETMLFCTSNKQLNGFQERYTSRFEALFGHLLATEYAWKCLCMHPRSYKRAKIAQRKEKRG